MCKVQDVMGEHIIWEVPRNKNSRAVNVVMTSIGGEGILMVKSKVWTNSPEVRKAIEEEEAKRGLVEKLHEERSEGEPVRRGGSEGY